MTTNSRSKLSRFTGVAGERGWQEAVEAAIGYVVWNSKSELLNLTVSDEIIDLRSDKLLVEEESRESVEYTGVHETVPDPFVPRTGRVTTGKKYLRILTDSCVIGPHGVVKQGNRRILPATVGWSGRDQTLKRRFSREYGLRELLSEKSKPSTSMDNCFLLCSRYRSVNNFGLFLVETLTKLYWYDRYVQLRGREPTIVTPQLREYQRRILEHMGYDSDTYYELTDETISASQLLLPPQPGQIPRSPWRVSTEAIRWVRDELTRDTDPGGYPERIYISRDDAGWRHVANEGEVMALLSEYGFSKFVVSELDILDQIRLFVGADVVVGPHGAGNAHMIHAEGCTWIEMFPGQDGIKPFYFDPANRLGHDYEYVVAEPDGFQHPTKRDPRHRDMRVDVDRLEAVLTNVGL